MKQPADGHVRNPTGLLVPMEYRTEAKNEVLKAVSDRYPPEKETVWNLSVIDQILEHPDEYPVMHGILIKAVHKDQRRIMTGVLREAGFIPESVRNGKNCPYYRRPAGVAA
jgi:hypothetical protein